MPPSCPRTPTPRSRTPRGDRSGGGGGHRTGKQKDNHVAGLGEGDGGSLKQSALAEAQN